MRNESTKEIYATWRRQKGMKPAPERAGFSPTAFGRHLRDVFLLDRGPDGEFRFRIAGSSLCTLFGGEMRGESFLSAMTYASLADAREVLAAATEDMLPVVIGASAILRDGMSLEVEMLILPMMHEGRSDTRIFGALSYRSADRTQLGECAGLDILTFRIIGERDAPMLVTPGIEDDLSLSPVERRGHLSVYAGGQGRA